MEDLFTIGKAIGGGVPCGALGLSAEVEARMLASTEADYEDTGGVGGTLAGNALSLAAMRATSTDTRPCSRKHFKSSNWSAGHSICGTRAAGMRATLTVR